MHSSYSSVHRLIGIEGKECINRGMSWSFTPEGHVVWMKRNRIFNLYFQHPIMNVEALPPDAISCADDPLLPPTPLF